MKIKKIGTGGGVPGAPLDPPLVIMFSVCYVLLMYTTDPLYKFVNFNFLSVSII